jgi:hypothetical protein
MSTKNSANENIPKKKTQGKRKEKKLTPEP